MADPAAIDDLATRIASIESGTVGDNPYGITGPPTRSGDRAYGKYQIMGANIPAWTRDAMGQALTPQQFLAQPDVQDTTAKHRLGQYLDQTGGSVRDAASLWHAGVPYAQAVAEGRHDRNMRTQDYADRVAAGAPDAAAPDQGEPNAVNPLLPSEPQPPPPNKMVGPLPDGSYVDLGTPNPTPALLASARDRIWAKFPELNPASGVTKAASTTTTDTSQPITPGVGNVLRGTSVEESAKLFNRAAGIAEDHPVGKYVAAAGKPVADAMYDLYDAIATPPPAGAGLRERFSKMLQAGHIIAAGPEALGNLAYQATLDGTKSPTAAAIAGTAFSTVAAMLTPLGGAARTPEVIDEAAAALERAVTARGVAEEAAAKAAPSVEQATAAEAALRPAGAVEAGRTAQAAATAGTQAIKQDVQGEYDAISSAAQKLHFEPLAEAPDLPAATGRSIPSALRAIPTNNAAKSEQALADIANLRDQFGGLITGQQKKVVDDVEAALQAGKPIPYSTMENFKSTLDSLLPGKTPREAPPKVAAMYNFKWQFRNLMRDVLEQEDPQLAARFDQANARWESDVIPNQRFAAAREKVDPEIAFARTFGSGTTAQNAAYARRMMNLATAAEQDTLQRGLLGTLVRKATNEITGELDPKALVTAAGKLDPAFAKVMLPKYARSFFKGLADQQVSAKRAEEWATAAEQYARGVLPDPIPTWAHITARGLEFAGGGAAGAAVGHPFYGALIARGIIPADKLAEALATPRSASLLARAIRTPINSAVIPTLVQSLKDAGVGVQYVTPEEREAAQTIPFAIEQKLTTPRMSAGGGGY
jgi:hypothetical protein